MADTLHWHVYKNGALAKKTVENSRYQTVYRLCRLRTVIKKFSRRTIERSNFPTNSRRGKDFHSFLSLIIMFLKNSFGR